MIRPVVAHILRFVAQEGTAVYAMVCTSTDTRAVDPSKRIRHVACHGHHGNGGFNAKIHEHAQAFDVQIQSARGQSEIVPVESILSG